MSTALADTESETAIVDQGSPSLPICQARRAAEALSRLVRRKPRRIACHREAEPVIAATLGGDHGEHALQIE